jgi:excisionase family DNA binding protein
MDTRARTANTTPSSSTEFGNVVGLDAYRARQAARRAALAVAGFDDRDVMTVRDLAHYLSLSLNTTYAYLADGTIPGRRVGRRWIISRARIEAWLEANTDGGR